MKKIWTIITTALINRERSTLNLAPVTYDYQLNTFLKGHNVPDSWYYAETNKYINWTIEKNDRYCNINLCHFKPLNNSYLFRETYKDSIPKIIRMRLNQRHCNHTDFKDGMPCSWWYVYYKTLMDPNLKSYACKSLNHQGTWVPDWLKNIQKKAFVCYSNHKVFYWPIV